MKLRFVIFSILSIIMVSVILPREIMIVEIEDRIPDSLFKHFGTRSKNIQILRLTSRDCEDRERMVLIVKGWIFVGSGTGVGEEAEDELKMIGQKISTVMKVHLKRKGMYLNLGPYLLILPSDVERLKVMGLEVKIEDL